MVEEILVRYRNRDRSYNERGEHKGSAAYQSDPQTVQEGLELRGKPCGGNGTTEVGPGMHGEMA